MPTTIRTGRLAALAACLIVPVTFAARGSVYHVLPFAMTSEPERLARLLRVSPGQRVAEVGAGFGDMAAAIAPLVGPQGVIYATEIAPDRRAAITQRATDRGLSQLRTVEAAEQGTALPDGRCEALYMRNVFHHIDDRAAYARDVARTVAPNGRVVIIDMPPGALWHLGPDHGVRAEDVIEAFTRAGFTLDERVDQWGGGMFALAFAR